MSRLFRSEVVEAKRGEWLGTIRLATPISQRVLTGCAVLIGAGLVGFAVVGQYTRREHATGTLVPVAGLIEVPAAAAGVVTRTFVAQGAVVHAGDSLVAVTADRVSATLGDTGSIVSEQLRLQRARIDADLADQQTLEQRQGAAFGERIGMLQAQLAQLDGQIGIQQQQARNARAMFLRFKPLLDKGYISALQVQQQEAAALDAEAQLKALARQRLDAQQQVAAQQEQLRQLPLNASTQRRDFERRRAELEQSLALNEVSRSAILRAPQDGVVSTLMVKAGQTVSAGQITVALVPEDSPLEAQLLVPSRAIGFVEPGNRVVLRYQAFPYQKFGLHAGRVRSVSRNAMTPAQVSGLFGQQANEAMYRIDVELDAQTIETYGRQEALKPGMALEADILLDRRRLVEWIFEPLLGMGKQVALIR